jgi:hypothetical protein
LDPPPDKLDDLAVWACQPSYLAEAKGTAIVNYATTAALEETLHCADRSNQFAQLQSRLPDVGESLEAL